MPSRQGRVDAARRALSDPLRVRIWESLAAQPCTAKRLGERLRLLPNRLYYHLRMLLAVGLIEVVGTESTGRMVERVYAASRELVSSELGRGSPEGRILFFASLLETTRTEIAEVVTEQGDARMPQLSLLRRAVRTSPDGFSELIRGVRELVDEIEQRQPAGDEVEYRLLFTAYRDPTAR